MTCEEILTMLEMYRRQIIDVAKPGPGTEITISSAYSFVIIEYSDTQIQFAVNSNSAKLDQLYPHTDSIKTKIEAANWPNFSSKNTGSLFSNEVSQLLATADSIASVAVNCTSGDNYAPGNFSKIIYNNSQIELQQINHMNSRSLNHKNDYSLRSLTIKIDLKDAKELEIDFTDHSSETNKYCGNEIKAAIANLSSPSPGKP